MAEIISGTEKFGSGKEYYKPSTSDDGEQWASILETFMERIALHTHDGSDSEAISLNISKVEDIRSGGTALNLVASATAGLYEDTITMPAGVDKDNIIKFYTFDGFGYPTEFFPDVEFQSTTSYKIIVNQPSLPNVKIYYF